MKRRIGFPQVLFAPDSPSPGGASNSGGDSGSSSGSGGGASSSPSSAPSGDSTHGASANPVSPSASPTAASGAAPTPPSGLPSPTPAAPPSTVGEDFFDFSGLGGSDDTDDDFESTPSPKPPTQGEPPKPPTQQQTPPQQAQTPAAQEQQPQPTQQQQPTPTGQQEAAPRTPTPAEPQRIAESLLQNSDALIQHLAESEFKLSPEDVEALETDAPKHIPTLLARAFFKTQVNMYQQLSRVIPAMVQQMQTVQQRNGANEGKFYAKWPDLKPELHGPIVRRYATVYRQANPQATLDQMIEDLGPMVMMAAKVQPSQQAQPGNGVQTPPPAMRPVSRVPSSPFRPAVGGASAPQPSADDNPWAGLMGPTDDNDE